jgi:hypothetical protein
MVGHAPLQEAAADRERIDFFSDYYCGAHPLPWLAPQAREEFRRILKMTRSNYMGLVCDATAERAQVVGFRVGDAAEGDKDSQRIWQANNMDFYSDQAILESIITGKSFLMVAPNPTDERTRSSTAEHVAGHRRVRPRVERARAGGRAEGVGRRLDGQMLHATCAGRRAALQVPGAAPRCRRFGGPDVWNAAQVKGEAWPAKNPLGEVPLYEIPNNPRMLGGGVSEISDVTDIQDRINKTLADRLITQDYGAFPQKWATAWPDEDDSGQPAAEDRRRPQPHGDVERRKRRSSGSGTPPRWTRTRWRSGKTSRTSRPGPAPPPSTSSVSCRTSTGRR